MKNIIGIILFSGILSPIILYSQNLYVRNFPDSSARVQKGDIIILEQMAFFEKESDKDTKIISELIDFFLRFKEKKFEIRLHSDIGDSIDNRRITDMQKEKIAFNLQKHPFALLLTNRISIYSMGNIEPIVTKEERKNKPEWMLRYIRYSINSRIEIVIID